jgi:hypothetical protein
MATITKIKKKYKVQIKRKGYPAITKRFHDLKDAINKALNLIFNFFDTNKRRSTFINCNKVLIFKFNIPYSTT